MKHKIACWVKIAGTLVCAFLSFFTYPTPKGVWFGLACFGMLVAAYFSYGYYFDAPFISDENERKRSNRNSNFAGVWGAIVMIALYTDSKVSLLLSTVPEDGKMILIVVAFVIIWHAFKTGIDFGHLRNRLLDEEDFDKSVKESLDRQGRK